MTGKAVVWLRAACVALCVCFEAGAYELRDSRWPRPTARFCYSIPGSDGLWDDGFEDALLDWNGSSGFEFVLVRDEYRDPCEIWRSPEGTGGVKFAPVHCSGAFGAALAVEHRWVQGGRSTHSGIVFRSDVPWNVYSGSSWLSAWEFRRVAVHELGHSIGLDHELNVSSIMGHDLLQTEHPTPDDVAGVHALYPELVPEPSPSVLRTVGLAALAALAARARRRRRREARRAAVRAGCSAV